MIDKKQMCFEREKYIDELKSELLGPGSEITFPDKEHEIITESPDNRYSIGILYPKESFTKTEEDEKEEFFKSESNAELEPMYEDISNNTGDESNKKYVQGEEDCLDEEINLASQNKPSSMGIIFFAKGNTDKLVVHLNFGTYQPCKEKDYVIPFKPKNKDTFQIPEELYPYVFYDSSDDSLKLRSQNGVKNDFNRKKLASLIEMYKFEDSESKFIDSLKKLAGLVGGSYIRTPHNVDVEINFLSDFSDANKEIDGTNLKIVALRRKIEDGLYTLTVMIVNDAIDTDRKLRAQKCIYQPEIIVETKNNNFIFYDYSQIIEASKLSDEDISMEMQYRNKRKFATGLGSAANWDIDELGEGIIFTDLFPSIEIPQMDFSLPDRYKVSKETFLMKYLSDFDDDDRDKKILKLTELAFSYKKWIEDLKKKQISDSALNDENKYKRIALKNIRGCEKCLSRMLAGLEVLKNNNNAWIAFELANRAMFMQRAHIKIQEMYKDYDPNKEEEKISFLESIDYFTIDENVKDYYSWRPFQLAFILMSIVSIVCEDSEDREMVDLIWFPTGGGKTEAYLGLTAFTIFYRRLAHLKESSGTAVIMRYTLRLLTSQQFTRASTLICACEYIRKDSVSKKPKYKAYMLGDERITIGLWIGNEHTPNTIQKAEENLCGLRECKKPNNLKLALDRYNKFQVLNCPWCGKSLVKRAYDNKLVGDWGYKMHNKHFMIWCPQEGCHFNSEPSLPLQIIDEELYKCPPTLLFGTVDKFAMLPWNSKIGSFFGVDTNNKPPELIIQDELHLISGPLGTMVGIYETAVEELCSSKGGKAKIIASTATIKGAEEQCSALYNRQVSQFPSPGLDAEDSFFAKEKKINHESSNYGRIYVGLMTSGKSKAMSQDRVISALLQKMKMMEMSDEIKDKFWTVTAYFNSLKELGKCRVLVEDDVIEFIRRMAVRLGSYSDIRYISQPDELTSRVSTTDLNETMNKLEKMEYSKDSGTGKCKPSDIVLATNMISVGIDISRLNVMLMIGQPKLTSEYIQASSRVGREYPGVVFTLYDGSRSRDRSHYEQFFSYHSSFYKYVEPTGITPFSDPARERALPSVVISMMRNLIPEIRKEKDAGKYNKLKYKDITNHIKEVICDRNRDILERMPLEMENNTEQIEMEIDKILYSWDAYAQCYGDDFIYGETYIKNPYNNTGNNKACLLKTFENEKINAPFESMTSMRNVDKQLEGALLIWEDDYNE